MPESYDEQQRRLERLCAAQLASRDPGDSKIPGYDWRKHAAKKQPKRRPFPLNEWYALPPRMKDLLRGLAFGFLLAFILRLTVLTAEYELLMIVPIFISMVVGFIVGSMFEDKPIR